MDGFMVRRGAQILARIIAPGLVCIIVASCKDKSRNESIIITEVPANIQRSDSLFEEPDRYLPGARIAILNPDDPASHRVLTGDFYSASSPVVSYDGKKLLFAAQQKENGLYQIWEMDLDDLGTRKVVSLNENCTDPVYLPDGRLVFSRQTINDTIRKGNPLYVSNPDGSAVMPITFSPDVIKAPNVLKDGRLLAISRQLIPEGSPMLMVLRPDGTKADMFYNGNGSKALIGRAKETSDGRIIFIEYGNHNDPGGDIISIHYNRPLHSAVNLTAGINGSFRAVLPLQSGRMLVSYRGSGGDNYSLYEFDPVKKNPDRKVYTDPGYDIIDIVAAAKSERPKKLPSEVDMNVKTGLLLCQDINVTAPNGKLNNMDTRKAALIEVMGIDSSYGIVPVDSDGSFYLKVFADKPFQIRTLNKDGKILDGPCSWLWLRPNERRGCVGCHEDPELVPANRIPLAVKKQPVIIPVHISKVKEKVVELE